MGSPAWFFTYEFPQMKTVPFPEFTDDEALPCLPRTMTSWAIRRRRRRPVHTGASCCWYHGGSWTSASHLARDIISEGRKHGLKSDDLGGWADRAVDQADWIRGWLAEAVQSLVAVESAILLEPDDDGGLLISEGRHRLAAMFDTGVSFTVTVRPSLIDSETGQPHQD